jgi:hypothetical protein
MKREKEKWYYYQFWEWPGKQPDDSYTFWRFADRYTLSGWVFKKYFATSSTKPEWLVNNERTFTVDLL